MPALSGGYPSSAAPPSAAGGLAGSGGGAADDDVTLMAARGVAASLKAVPALPASTNRR